jgi:hypothetical protein
MRELMTMKCALSVSVVVAFTTLLGPLALADMPAIRLGDEVVRPVMHVRNGAAAGPLIGALPGDPSSIVTVTTRSGHHVVQLRSPRLGAMMSAPTPVGEIPELLPALHVEPEHVCGNGCSHEPFHHTRGYTLRTSAHRATTRSACDDPTVVDLLVLYTDDTVASSGSAGAVEALIQTGVDNINLALSNSGVTGTINLVGAVEVNYAEAGDGFTELTRLREQNDGFLDIAHELRDSMRADLVMLVTQTGGPCGVAGYGVLAGPTPLPDNAFSWVNINCIGGGVLAFAHEIGHNLGLFHDWPGDQTAFGPEVFAKGYTAPDESFQTLMSIGPAPRELVFSSPGVLFNGQPTGTEGDLAQERILAQQPANAVDVLPGAIAIVSQFRTYDHDNDGVCDADEITMGTATDIDGNTVPDEAEFDCDGNGLPDRWEISLNGALDADGDGLLDACEAARLYVDVDAVGTGSGLSWTGACVDLQSALDIATRSDGTVTEIWVAEGSYAPTSGTARAIAFDLPGGVALLGGFAGGETLASEADPAAHPTILTGDTSADDASGFANRSDNAFTILSAISQTDPIIVDGFTIRGGNGDLESPLGGTLLDEGGAVVTFRADVTFSRCRFEENQASLGGAMSISNFCRTFVLDCDLVENRSVGLAVQAGPGAVFTQNNTAEDPLDFPTFERCRFIANTAVASGGAVTNIGATPTYINCIFIGNAATRGAAMSNAGSVDTPAIVINSSFVQNIGGQSIIENFRSNPTIVNSLFWANVTSGPASFSTQINNIVSSPIVTHCLIEGWMPADGGVGNRAGDPLLLATPSDGGDGYGDDPATPGIDESLNDTLGDLRLGAASDAIDAADNTAIPPGVVSDLAGAGRFLDDPNTVDSGIGPGPIADIGAFEFVPVTCPGDVDGDGSTNLSDFSALAGNFGATGLPFGSGQSRALGDLNDDGAVNLTDFSILGSNFGCTP